MCAAANKVLVNLMRTLCSVRVCVCVWGLYIQICCEVINLINRHAICIVVRKYT